jgi:ATP-dependent exoDNAse (exonuclease V) beta subunit
MASIEQSLPDATGAFVRWLVHESGWTVSERRTTPVPIEERHICILFRRFVNFGADVTRPYVDALEARGLRHLLVGGRAFHGREEIETLRAALGAIEWPDDQLAVFATLRGALFAISDEDLLEYRHAHASAFHPFRIPPTLPDHLQPIAEALRTLAELHGRRNRRPVAETITRLLAATRAHVGFALRRAGEQVLANVLHVAELARQYEMSDGISFRGFIDALQQAAEDGQATEAPIVEDGSNGVRLMTVHKAKGLEFPVVILADMTAKIAPSEASRHVDAGRGLCALRIGGWSPRDLLLQQPMEQAREREEGVRVAYVAATRARDLLVVPAIGDQPYDGGWVSPLDGAIFPPVAQRRHAAPAPACPPFRRDSVLLRPDDGTAQQQTVSPGAHRVPSPAGDVDVVWWDPAALQLGADPPFGLRRQELIAKDVEPEIVADGQRRYIDWRNARAAAIASAARPSLDVRVVSQWAHAAGAHAPADADLSPGEVREGAGVDVAGVPAVEIVSLDEMPGRPAGPRFGTLVHAVLATTALDAGADTVAQIAATQGRVLGATDVEIASCRDTVLSVLRHPVIARASRAADGELFREAPVTLVREGVLYEGVVDVAYQAGDEVVVVDFKTDRAAGERLAAYTRQVALYAEAVAQATGRRARAVLMQV